MLTYLGFYASVFLNVVTEFSCALGSRFVIECWVHLQQSHFCHHKVFILKKQNHKDHKTQGRHRGGSAETKELFSQMLNQSILPSLWGNSISWLLFTFLQSCPWDKGNRIDKCYHRWYQFHSMHCHFCCKGKRKEMSTIQFNCVDDFDMLHDFFKWVTLNSFCNCCDVRA